MLQICRTCLHEIPDSNFFTLTNNSAVAVIIKNQLALCVPEVIPDIVSDPIMCHACVTALHSAFDFKYRCLQSEERIRNFVQSNGIHNDTVAIKLVEMFSHIYGEICANRFADAVEITQETQLITNCDTSLDIKCEPLSIDEDEVELAKTVADTVGNHFMDIYEKSVDCRLSNQDAIPAEICTLEKLCDAEELQLHFNCMFIEQSKSEKATHIENELSMISIIPTDNGSYNLEDWNRFEERLIYCGNPYMEDDCEEDGGYCNAISSYNTVQLHLRGNEKIVAVNKKEKESNFSQSSVRRRRRIGTTRGKMKTRANTERLSKCKKVSYKKLKFLKPVKSRKSNAVTNLFKCSECKYTTKFQINLELHSVSHIEINDYECDTKAYSNVQQRTTSYNRKNASKSNKGYEYFRYDYPKKKTIKLNKS